MTTSEVRVLHVLPDVREIGNGIVDVTVDLAIAQADAGLRVVVASAGGEYERLLGEHGVETVRIALRLGGLPALRRVVRDVRPSVIHTHTLKGLVLARLAAPGRPVLTTAHRDLGRWSVAMRLATRVVSVSRGIADRLARFVPRERISVVPNGVLGSARRAHLLAVAPAEFIGPAVVYVGGIYEHKGVGVLLEAFAELVTSGRDAGATLHVVGDGPHRQRYEALTEHLGIAGRVQWAGFRRDAYAWIRSADVFVLPSLLETFGLVLAEARQAGVAIVASATGGVPETLDGGRAGLLVPPGDAPALAAALHTVLTDDVERARLQTAGAADTGWLTVDRMLQDILREYADVLDLVESGRA